MLCTENGNTYISLERNLTYANILLLTLCKRTKENHLSLIGFMDLRVYSLPKTNFTIQPKHKESTTFQRLKLKSSVLKNKTALNVPYLTFKYRS